MGNNYPLVTVYISTYNRVELLKRAVKSVQQQTYKNLEIIIVDDNSTDNTEVLCNELKQTDDRIIYLKNSVNSGACITRNRAIFTATGDFITGLDDDDEFLPNRIEVFLQKWSDRYSFISSNFTNYYSSNNKKNNYLLYGVFNKKSLLFDNLASNQIFTKTIRLKNINGFNEKFKRLQDWDCWLRLAMKYGEFYRIRYSTYIMYHDHEFSRVSSNLKFKLALKNLYLSNKDFYNNIDKYIFINVILGRNFRKALCYMLMPFYNYSRSIILRKYLKNIILRFYNYGK